MIKLTKICKHYNDTLNYVVDDISFVVQEGETLVLLGSSGSGKTTTLKMINRLIEPTSGKIEIDGINTADLDPVQLRRSIGYVFQTNSLFPHMTVEENITVSLRLTKVGKPERKEVAYHLLDLVNLNPNTYAKRFPQELSGGQRQRVGVARALSTNPKYLLMDEPLGALDAVNRKALQQEIISLRERLKKTIVFVTHDIFEAIRLGDRIAVMNHGKMQQIGTEYDLIHHPKTPFVEALFHSSLNQHPEYHGQR